jgi:predicted DNA-binding protein with PD1-like motif
MRSHKEQVEVLSFAGNIAETDGNPQLHAHVVIGKLPTAGIS